MTNIAGEVADGFEPVREAFQQNFVRRADIGAAVSIYHRGDKIVDLWGGEARRGEPWVEDTLALVWSTTKGMSAFVAQLLSDRSDLELDSPVVAYWPEFGANGKNEITVRDVLSHGARLPYIPGYRGVMTVDSPAGWGNVAGLVALAESATPVLGAGDHGYHALSFGVLLGEIVKRATGQTLGTVFREEIAEPLGLETYIGLPDSVSDRVAELQLTMPPPPTDDPVVLAAMAEAMGPNGPVGQALLVGDNGLDGYAAVGNSHDFRAAEFPAANGVTDARSLAKMYGLLANGGEIGGVRLTTDASIAAQSAQQWRGTDATLGDEKRYSSGYMLAGTPAESFGPNPDAFGHPGMGGSLGFADSKTGIGFGYVMNHMVFEVAVDPRVLALTDALYSCL